MCVCVRAVAVAAAVADVGARGVAERAAHAPARGTEAPLQHQERLRHAAGAHTASQRQSRRQGTTLL